MAMKYNPLSGEFDYTVDVAQTLGDSADKAISQKAFSAKINEIKDAMGEIPEFSSVVEGKISYNKASPVSGTAGDIIYSLENNMFLYRDSSGTYYKGWSNVSDYMDGDTPKNGTYKCGGQLYVYKDGSLQISQSGGAGLESVENLPYDNLYDGRAVICQGRVYVYYNDGWISIADELGGKPETHAQEFLYQPTASDLSVKDGYAKIKRIKGKTLVWNSLVKQNGSSIDSSGLTIKLANYKVSIKGTLSGTNWATVGVQSGVGLKAGHKYLYGVSKQIPAGYYLAIHDNAGSLSNSRTKTARIYEAQGDSTYSLYIVGSQNEQAVGTVYDYESYIKLFDLTQMFGEGNEPATVEEFEAMFPEPYYEYNAGALLSHDSTGIKSVGFNQWDEEWEIGTISNDGNNISSTVQIRSRNYISIIAGAEYFLSSHLRPSITFRVFFYDNNKTFISNTNVTGSRFTVPSNAAYMRLTTATGAYGTTYNNDICINLSHSGYRNGEYEPYMEYVAKWADGKKISELTSNGEIVFPNGLMSAGDVFDEITTDESGQSVAIKRVAADAVNLTATPLESPVTYILDEKLNLDYKVWDFGTEEILTDGFTNFFKADIEYGFNAVDMIRNNYFAIKEIKEKLPKSMAVSRYSAMESDIISGYETNIWSIEVPAKSEVHARVTVTNTETQEQAAVMVLGFKNEKNCFACSCTPLPVIREVGHTINLTHWFEEKTVVDVFIKSTNNVKVTDICPVGGYAGASELIIKTFGE